MLHNIVFLDRKHCLFTAVVKAACMSSGGNGDGGACVFPWREQGYPDTFYGCANPDGHHTDWCAVTLDSSGFAVKWGNCDGSADCYPSELSSS